ncbi:hypothetical protein EII34_04980 [Arachnia propionica]|uniref:Uncharacterized protein n=1 Tax=Arachnia propionica TaxID=1750 RepID=A0A3P1T9N7_9ACTN|nr:hypothetical protein [Arachnia propionica]MDO5084279.1 hypothetical protein [Arachnia propionica]RRD06040.1 hypothetical protein EII34_04980 [Arachnia propionica]
MKRPLVRVGLSRLVLEFTLAGAALVLCVPLVLTQPSVESLTLLAVLLVLAILLVGTLSGGARP